MKTLITPLQLTLYVSSTTGEVGWLVEQVRALLAAHRVDESGLTVVDLAAEPERAEQARILATPTLVREAPGRARRIIGDFSDARAVARALGLGDTAGEPAGEEPCE